MAVHTPHSRAGDAPVAYGNESRDDRADSTGASQVEPALPFADATNRHSMIRLDDEATSSAALGLGYPFMGQDRPDRRDVTTKARQPVHPSPTSFAFPSQPNGEPRPAPTVATRPAHAHRHTKSASSISHPPIPEPSYPVRSQPIGLSRSSSLSSSSSFGSVTDLAAQTAAPASEGANVVGSHLKRLSLSSMSGSEAEKDGETPKSRRPGHPLRSDSLLSFPPPPRPPKQDHLVSKEDLATLPPNPKLWLPSHLSLYLISSLSLPPTVRADVTAFIRSSRLSGRAFLRLREADLEELGINVRWRAALLDAREALRREALGGRVLWGYEGAAHVPPPEIPKGHRRGGSWQGTNVDVEGSASEDESSKEEWKLSWRASQGAGVRERVKGLRRAFETVDEASDGGSPEKPASVRAREKLPYDWRHWRSDSAASEMSAASVDSSGGQYASLSSSSFAVSSSTAQFDDPFLVTASMASPGSASKPSLSLELDPLAARLEVNLSAAPISPTSHGAAHARHLPFSKGSPAPMGAESAQMPRMRPEGTLRAAGAKGGSGRHVSFREFSTSNSSAHDEDGGGDESEDDDPTLRPVRSPLSSPPMSPRAGSLAELFGLDVPRIGNTPRAHREELVEMFVPGLPRPREGLLEPDDNETRRGGKKGSLVLVKKSQFAALQRRMSEVETQLALALGSAGLSSASEVDSEAEVGGDELGWEYKGEKVDEERLKEMEGRLEGLELRATHLTTSLPASPTPSARAFALLPTPPPSSSSATLSTAYPAASTSSAPRRRGKARHRHREPSAQDDGEPQEELHSAWPIDGWRQLSGYVFAASIGIGIVAGEVVAAKILGLRRR